MSRPSPAQRRVLAALARGSVLWQMAGYWQLGGKTVNVNTFARLRHEGWIEEVASSRWRITDAGRAALGEGTR